MNNNVAFSNKVTGLCNHKQEIVSTDWYYNAISTAQFQGLWTHWMHGLVMILTLRNTDVSKTTVI
jgi:hypothetical protein